METCVSGTHLRDVTNFLPQNTSAVHHCFISASIPIPTTGDRLNTMGKPEPAPLDTSRSLDSSNAAKSMDTPNIVRSSSWNILGSIRRVNSDVSMASTVESEYVSGTDSTVSTPSNSPRFTGYLSKLMGFTDRDTLNGRDMNILTPTSL